jgi:hypothetical protein
MAEGVGTIAPFPQDRWIYFLADYRSGAVPPCGLVYVQVRYAVGLRDHPVRHAIAEGVADRGQ